MYRGAVYRKSLAALVLLVRGYHRFEVDEWMDFRLEYLGQFDVLECFYCGKIDLKAETENEDELATVDHVVPLAKGGDKYDPENLVVACLRCNNNKKDKLTYKRG